MDFRLQVQSFGQNLRENKKKQISNNRNSSQHLNFYYEGPYEGLKIIYYSTAHV